MISPPSRSPPGVSAAFQPHHWKSLARLSPSEVTKGARSGGMGARGRLVAKYQEASNSRRERARASERRACFLSAFALLSQPLSLLLLSCSRASQHNHLFPNSHLQKRLRVPRVREGDERKPAPFHHRDVGERAELGGVFSQDLGRGPVRDAADEELARLVCVWFG